MIIAKEFLWRSPSNHNFETCNKDVNDGKPKPVQSIIQYINYEAIVSIVAFCHVFSENPSQLIGCASRIIASIITLALELHFILKSYLLFNHIAFNNIPNFEIFVIN